MERKSIYILMHIYMLKINNNIYNLRIFIDFPIKFQKQNAISFYLREINNFRKNYQEYRDVKVLTTEIKVGGDDEEIREDDGDTDHEDEARLHESLQRGLLHAATLSSCIPPPALRCCYPSPPLYQQPLNSQVPGSPGSSHLVHSSTSSRSFASRLALPEAVNPPPATINFVRDLYANIPSLTTS